VHASDVLRAASGSGLECLDAENPASSLRENPMALGYPLEQHADEAAA